MLKIHAMILNISLIILYYKKKHLNDYNNNFMVSIHSTIEIW